MYRNDGEREPILVSAAVGHLKPSSPAKDLYFDLLANEDDQDVADRARHYLDEQLEKVARKKSDLPAMPGHLASWAENRLEQVGLAYRGYVRARQGGEPRRYFSTRSHALFFLQSVAPTKLVDGAWLYGLTRAWRDHRYHSLIRTYLEELGEGQPSLNHVVLYRNLLAKHGCGHWQDQSDAHFVQGAIQLAFSRNAQYFLPELIGFNLGYEQLPLHLLITAYELNELGIDPYYFTLHVTIDNAATGHAREALQAVQHALPKLGDAEHFHERMVHGYLLNDLGLGTESLIAGFDLEREVLDVFKRKSVFGKHLHADYCRVGGRPLSDWLADPENMHPLLRELQQQGWIKRDRDPVESRFWKLLQGEKAKMFGVFDAYEMQLVYDWIAGDLARESTAMLPRPLSFRVRQDLGEFPQNNSQARKPDRSGLVEEALAGNGALSAGDFGDDECALMEALTDMGSNGEVLDALIRHLSPARHHSASGLLATRLFTKAFELS